MLLRNLDWPGLTYAAIGFGLLFAGLDQGNRLDWAGSGLINGLLLAGGGMTLIFVVRELVTARPFLNLRALVRGQLLPLMLLLSGFRFIILSTGASFRIICRACRTSANCRSVAQQASVLSYVDGFLAATIGAFACLMLVASAQATAITVLTVAAASEVFPQPARCGAIAATRIPGRRGFVQARRPFVVDLNSCCVLGQPRGVL